MAKKKIGIIVQRYGKEVNGGAETLARMVAEKLTDKYDVTVLTSLALNYHRWKPTYPAGETEENGVKIIRFDNREGVGNKALHKLNRKYRGRHLYQKIYRALGRPAWYEKLFPGADVKHLDPDVWLLNQGPATIDLIPYLKENVNNYNAYIFVTYQYYPTALGVQAVGHKSIMLPTMHDDAQARFPVFQKVMAAPKVLLFLTPGEKRFSEAHFPIANIKREIAGVGIDLPDDYIDPDTLSKFGITGRYIIYVGRIDEAKGCKEMLNYFHAYVQETKSDLKLVLAGKNMMGADESMPGTIFTGFISDEDKVQLMKQADVLIMPSKYESLSLVLLESFACKVPVLANEECEVLKDHIEMSGGGWVYNGGDRFKEQLAVIVKDPELRVRKGLAGYKYVTENYTWEKVMQVFDDAIQYVAENQYP